jgi:broad specificity phosphatase PhoE
VQHRYCHHPSIQLSVADPDLTALGKSQAASANDLWKTEVDAQIPLPQKMYSSPLTRALRTNAITFDGIPFRNGVKTVVVEVRYSPFPSYADE